MLDKELLNYLGKEKKKIFIIVLLNCLGLILSVSTTIFFVMSLHNFINEELTVGLQSLAFALLCGILKIITTKFSSSIANKLAEYVTYKLRNETYTKFLSLNGHTPFTVNEMAQLSTEGIEQLRLYYTTFIPSFFYAMIAPIMLFILFMFMDMPTAFLYLACVPLIPISIIAVSKWAKKIFNKYWNLYTSLGDDFLDNTRGMKELKIFKYDEERQKQMDGGAEGFRKITMKVLTMQLASVTIMDLVAFGGAGIGITLSLVAMRNGLDVYTTLVMILIGAEFFLPMRALGSAFHVAMNGATAGTKIKRLLKLEDEKDGNQELNEINNVKLDQLSFGYDAEHPILKSISIEFNQGFYSLVGISGSGKSTLAKLMSKSLKPRMGSISINGKDIYDYTNASFYNRVAYVSAGTYIFHNTIKELFKFYNSNINEEKMLELLHSHHLFHYSDNRLQF